MKAKLIKTKTGFYLWKNPLDKSQELLGATVPIMNDNGVDLREYILSLKNCQAIERGYDLDELAKLETRKYLPGCPENIMLFVTHSKIFQKGFQTALEIIGDKKFSEEDMREAISQTRKGMLYNKKYEDEHIQSLQQTEWNVTFNPEEKNSEGCLILKRL